MEDSNKNKTPQWYFPPLTISYQELDIGIDIIDNAIRDCLT